MCFCCSSCMKPCVAVSPWARALLQTERPLHARTPLVPCCCICGNIDHYAFCNALQLCVAAIKLGYRKELVPRLQRRGCVCDHLNDLILRSLITQRLYAALSNLHGGERMSRGCKGSTQRIQQRPEGAQPTRDSPTPASDYAPGRRLGSCLSCGKQWLPGQTCLTECSQMLQQRCKHKHAVQ